MLDTSPQHRKSVRASASAFHRLSTNRGFTLVELMISLTGALFLATTVFTLASYTTKIYQGETRTANATLSSVVGFERLRADLSRAGFMASANVQRDPFVCGQPIADGTWPTRLRTMTALEVTSTAPEDVPEAAANGLAPQQVVISGNFTTQEAFPVGAISQSGANIQITLQGVRAVGQLARLGYYDTDAAGQTQILQQAFPAGRAARIVDASGRHHYTTIVGATGGAAPVVLLSSTAPQVQLRSGSALGCGLVMGSDNSGATLNTVNFIRYRIGSLNTPGSAYAAVYATPTGLGPPYEQTRTELIREELDPADNIIGVGAADARASTQELVAEYAVDLRFGLTVARNLRTPLEHIAPTDVAAWVGPVGSLAAGQGPQQARSVLAILSIRSRQADRFATIANPNGPIYRIGLGSEGEAPFARVRSAQARITLNNLFGIQWN